MYPALFILTIWRVSCTKSYLLNLFTWSLSPEAEGLTFWSCFKFTYGKHCYWNVPFQTETIFDLIKSLAKDEIFFMVTLFILRRILSGNWHGHITRTGLSWWAFNDNLVTKDGATENQSLRSLVVFFSHLYRFFERDTSLINISREQYLVMRVDPGLNLSIKYQLWQLIFQVCYGCVERMRHLLHVRWHIRTEVLNKRSVSDLTVQGVHVRS